MNKLNVSLLGVLILTSTAVLEKSVHSKDSSDMYKRIEEQTKRIKENNNKIRERNESNSKSNGYGDKTDGSVSNGELSASSEPYINTEYVTYRSVTADNLELSLPILISAPDICGKIYNTKEFKSYLQVISTVFKERINIDEIELKANILYSTSSMMNKKVKNEICHTAKYLAKKHNFNYK